MAILLDSNSPYYADFTDAAAKNAVYLTGVDPLFGNMLTVIYKSPNAPAGKLSSLIFSSHGTSGFLDMTLSAKSRYFSAVQNLSTIHSASLVRQAIAISSLRSYATMDVATRAALQDLTPHVFTWDETTAGHTASKMKLVDGKFPDEIGERIKQLGLVEPKTINTALLDVVYVDSDTTIEKNNELVYLLGDQLEQLFDPLSEYSPEPTERLYAPPPADDNNDVNYSSHDNQKVNDILKELFDLQAHFKTNLISLLQDFVIPLRVKVLGCEMDDPEMTIRKLNSIFPPTIDEIVRINNILYESLQQAMPFGSFEVMKACGMTIPYFYKACMRHEAATRNFSRNLSQYYALFSRQVPSNGQFSPRVIESAIQCSLHLTRVKLVLERLYTESVEHNAQIDRHDAALMQEFYQSAAGTIDAFGREANATYDRRVFTPTGKVLVEFAKGWPKELEYGWINRRVVTIFDGVDLQRGSHHIVILFTDQLVILEPCQPIPMTNSSGMHTPSVADILMHSMINEQPLQHVPEMQVIAWAPIEDITMASYHNDKHLRISSIKGIQFARGPAKVHKHTAQVRHEVMYQLVRPDQNAAQFMSMLSKAQVMNKTQPFHLFKNESSKLALFATVHELQGYAQEVHKTPVALFMNVDISRDVLIANDLSACFKIEFEGLDTIRVQAFSTMGCGEFDRLVHRNEFASFINEQTAYLYSLHYSTRNPKMVDHIVQCNKEMTDHLITFASSKSERLVNSRNVSAATATSNTQRAVSAATTSTAHTAIIHSRPEVIVQPRPREQRRRVTPYSLISKFMERRASAKDPIPDRSHSAPPPRPPRSPVATPPPVPAINVVPEMSNSDSSSVEEYEFPPRGVARTSADDWEDYTEQFESVDDDEEDVSLRQQVMGANVVVVPGSSFASSDVSSSQRDRSLNRRVSIEQVSMASTDVDAMDSDYEHEQQERRDVSAWFKDYESSIDELSLSSFSTESAVEIEQDEAVRQLTKMFNSAPSNALRESMVHYESSRILDRIDSAYMMKVASAQTSRDLDDEFEDDLELEQNQKPEERGLILEDNASLNIDDDFKHLARFWNDSASSNSGNSRNKNMPRTTTTLWPGLRDSSIQFLGTYVHSRQNSSSDGDNAAFHPSASEWFSEVNPEIETLSTSLSSRFLLKHSSTAQLAAFTVDLDRVAAQRGNRDDAAELERIKQVVVAQYEQARSVLPIDHFDATHEKLARLRARQLTWVLVAMAAHECEYEPLVRGVLSMETLRRVRLHDTLGFAFSI